MDPSTLLFFGLLVVMFACGMAVSVPTEVIEVVAQPTDTLSKLDPADNDRRMKWAAIQAKKKELEAAQVAFEESNQAFERLRHAHVDSVNLKYPLMN